jgi:hypothetical protein
MLRFSLRQFASNRSRGRPAPLTGVSLRFPQFGQCASSGAQLCANTSYPAPTKHKDEWSPTLNRRSCPINNSRNTQPNSHVAFTASFAVDIQRRKEYFVLQFGEQNMCRLYKLYT